MWNTDMRQFGPDAYVSSVTLDFAKFYIEQVGARVRGDWKPEARFLTLGAGVDRDAWGKRVPEAVRAEADAVRARMLGGWSPFQGPLYDSEGKLRVAKGHGMNDMELYNWNWQLQGVSGLG